MFCRCSLIVAISFLLSSLAAQAGQAPRPQLELPNEARTSSTNVLLQHKTRRMHTAAWITGTSGAAIALAGALILPLWNRKRIAQYEADYQAGNCGQDSSSSTPYDSTLCNNLSSEQKAIQRSDRIGNALFMSSVFIGPALIVTAMLLSVKRRALMRTHKLALPSFYLQPQPGGAAVGIALTF